MCFVWHSQYHNVAEDILANVCTFLEEESKVTTTLTFFLGVFSPQIYVCFNCGKVLIGVAIEAIEGIAPFSGILNY